MNDHTLNLEPLWMPFTANRQFKAEPRLLESAEGMYYRSMDGREILDGTAGLWCVNAGHSRQEITTAVSEQIAKLDYAPPFQMGHPQPFRLAEKLTEISPPGLDHVFFTNSGSESVDTALKIALAYQQARGLGRKQRLIGREKGYHGVGFGGISVGGLANNRKAFGNGLAGTAHLSHTLLKQNAFSRGQPDDGAEIADQFEELIALNDAGTIAAVIIEPVAGSAGVLVPPKGYLERIREICTRHDILLILDEVITAYGRVGAPFAATKFGVTPDIITTAKGLTNGALPMGAVFVSDEIHSAFMQGPENVIELFHGYTYSGHPVAAAAGLAAMEIYASDDLFQRADDISGYFEEAVHSLANCRHVIDIRNFGLMAAVELTPRENAPGTRGYDVFNSCFFEQNILVRVTADVIALSPPLIIEKRQIDEIIEKLGSAIDQVE
jgi:beta-alanine--pyruvate transaminase|tara:strand:+ start:1675 stop:2991 length:1317 start_codon:yes stop_codon:yes gene_type:complete